MNQFLENRIVQNVRALLETRSLVQILAIILAVLAAIASALSGIFYPSSFSPLFIIVGLAGIAFLILTIRKPIYVLYLALFISILPTGLLSDTLHSFFNRNLTFFVLAVWGLDLLIHRRPVVWTITTSFMLAFLVWAAVTLNWAPYVSQGTDILQTYVQRFMLFFLILVNLVKTKDDLNGVMRAIGLVGLVIIVLSMETLAREGYTPGTRFALANINENDFGVTLMVTMMGVLWEGLRPENARKPLVKAIAGFYVLFVIGLTFLSGSRGSAITLVIILAFFAYMKPVRLWAVLIILALILTYLIAPEIFQTTIDRFLGEDNLATFGGREPIWQAGLQLVANNFWTGVGIGNAPYVVRPMVIGTYGPGMDRVSLHSPMLAIFGETGLLGFMLYMGMIFSAFIVMVKNYRDDIRSGARYLANYYPLVTAVFCGYMASWFKGGGMERDSCLFLLLALLLVPSLLKTERVDKEAVAAS